MNTQIQPFLLQLQNITVRAFNKILFNNLFFSIKKGQHWALTGSSGSGKTALLQVIAGKFNITGGDIIYHFFDEYCNQANVQPNDYFTVHRLIALVEQKHHFRNLSNTTDFYYQQRYNSFDADDSPTVVAYLQQISSVPGRTYWTIDRVTTLLNLNPLLQKQLIKLSNGETKRLRLAAALLKNPALLLLDNPLTGLDIQTRKNFNQIIKQAAASGIHIIMATSPHEIPDAITHVAVIDNGTIKETCEREKFNAANYQNQPDEIDTHTLTALIKGITDVPYKHIINMHDVNINYGSNKVLRHINWEVKPGERWALLGTNGAGKSTLLSLVTGDNPQAYANHIILFDQRRGTGESIWDIKRKFGYVSPELYQYFPADNNCLQVIESGYYDTMGLFRQSNKTYADKALQWMQVLEIDKYARLPLRNIPAAAQRLCLLARALVKNPPLLIFDEPCQGLDSHQQQHFKNVIDAICSISNVTLIFVTHYAHEIPDSVDKVLRLEKGEVD